MKSDFFRINFPSHLTVDQLVASKGLLGRTSELGAMLRRGHIVLAASYEPSSATGHVRAIGRVLANDAQPQIEWRPTSLTLHPSPQGQQQWKKEHFCFDRTVAQRYALQAHADKLFADLPQLASRTLGANTERG